MSVDEMFVQSVDRLALKCLFLIVALYNCSQAVNVSCCRTHVNRSSVSSTVTSNCVRQFIANQKKTQKEQRSCVSSTVSSNCIRQSIASQKNAQKEERSCVSSTAAIRCACRRHVITNI